MESLKVGTFLRHSVELSYINFLPVVISVFALILYTIQRNNKYSLPMITAITMPAITPGGSSTNTQKTQLSASQIKFNKDIFIGYVARSRRSKVTGTQRVAPLLQNF